MRDIDAARSIPPPRGLAADAEHLLWFYLRGRQLADCVFRRRHAIGPQVADFVCLERRLCLVIDAGGTDVAQRAAFLKARGFNVCRLEFRRVFEDTEQLLDEISDALADDASRGRCAGPRSQAARQAQLPGNRSSKSCKSGPVVPMRGLAARPSSTR